MNIDRALQTDGWMTTKELTYLAMVAKNAMKIVEVGSWKGRSTCALAENTIGVVYAIDTWQGSPEQGTDFDPVQVELEFHRNVKGLPVIPWKADSIFAAGLLDTLDVQFDLVFIDAKHAYESVKEDIQAWMKLVRRGGILCGHDYHECWPGVQKAVGELLPQFTVVSDTTIWTANL